jgi:hypothetical protein
MSKSPQNLSAIKITDTSSPSTATPRRETNLASLSKEKHQSFIDSQNNCPLCGSGLDFVHEKVPAAYRLREEGSCPSCNVRMIESLHVIH